MMDDNKLDLVRGSLIGGAIGDALGYPVEFMSYRHILEKYGEPGITRYELRYGRAEISDDTQMTLFTAAGMLNGLTRFYMRGIACAPHYYVQSAYFDWFFTQSMTMEERLEEHDKRTTPCTWLSAIPELYACRAPGTTCLTAVSQMIERKTPQNHSKGCGGIMRVAPWPLFCGTSCVRYSLEEINVAGGEIARLTHKHPLGWMPAILLTDIIFHLVKDVPLMNVSGYDAQLKFCEIVQKSIDSFKSLKLMEPISEITWSKDELFVDVFKDDWALLHNLVSKALQMALNPEGSDEENIRQLGEGWVAEETLAIAIYAVARHIDCFEDVIVAAVNHDGDSDSTGAVAGNIMGVIVGYDALPDYYKANLELHDIILAIADDLYQDCVISEYEEMDTLEKRQWYERYVMHHPSGFEQ